MYKFEQNFLNFNHITSLLKYYINIDPVRAVKINWNFKIVTEHHVDLRNS